jgi:hypothetical protein
VRGRHLLLLAVVVALAWVLLRQPSAQPWNVGQAGAIFGGGHYGGGQ